MRKLGPLAAGVIAGMLVATMVPAVAHHGPSYRRLANRVSSLEDRLFDVEGTLRSHQTGIANLQTKTQHLDAQGFYTASVWEFQVISEACQEGDDTVWIHYTADPVGLNALGCTVGAYRSAESRQLP